MYYLAIDLCDEDICSFEVYNLKKGTTYTIDSEEIFYESMSEFVISGRTKSCQIIPISYSLYQKYKKFIKNFNVHFSEKIETIKNFVSSDFPELII